ncbi:thioredoxin family protein [Halarsenatibacter silvermanii]|uniref:Thioredoxin n=1 Tax=Halarsenatibacter silvermanii TaxID=321763 RepID=A0A1G9R9X8_9FIRM|nr:thioredoxin family protein [Halarsenatibacter silvermanii]SDM20028.1 Thioredoxin [Halarsenatibacter silvermanii]
MIEVTKDNYKDEIGGGQAVLNFFLEGCRPCEELLKTLWELDEIVNVYRIDVLEALVLARDFGIKEVPALILYENGEYIRKISGSKLGHLEKEAIIEKLEI